MSLPYRGATHTHLELRARALCIPTKVIHNASIMNAIGACGLQLYRFGEVRRTEPMQSCTEAHVSMQMYCPRPRL